MSRIGKCECGGELSLNPLLDSDEPKAYCKRCLKEYPVEMRGKNRCYTLYEEKRILLNNQEAKHEKV